MSDDEGEGQRRGGPWRRGCRRGGCRWARGPLKSKFQAPAPGTPTPETSRPRQVAGAEPGSPSSYRLASSPNQNPQFGLLAGRVVWTLVSSKNPNANVRLA